MNKIYYVYAGYYELHLSAHKLKKPFTLLSMHRNFEDALEASDDFDSDAYKVFYKDTAEEYCQSIGFDLNDLFRDEIEFCVADAEEIQYPESYQDDYKPKYKPF